MKNFKIVFGLLVSLIFAGNSYAWTITDFHSDIQLNSDGSANVTETIQADFSQDSGKHGIFRFIPIRSKTSNGKMNFTPISQVSISNEHQIPRNFQESNKSDNIFLKIGDADRFVNPQETYVIKYQIDRVPQEFPENNFAEFYWNVTGDDWDAVIQKASATIYLPTPSKINKTTCFTGKYGSKEQNCSARMANGKAFFATNSPLYSGQGFTIDYGFDKGIVQVFPLLEISWWKVFFNRIAIWMLAALIPLFSAGYAWKKKKELEVDKPIIPKYEPPEGLHPTMIGTVIDGKYDKRDFIAGIVDLATHKLLEIQKKHIKGLIFDSDEYFLKKNPAKNKFHSNLRKSFYNKLFEDRKTGIFPQKNKNHMYEIFKSLQKKAELKKHFQVLGGGFGVGMSFLVFIPLINKFIVDILESGLNKTELFFGAFLLAIWARFSIYPKRNKAGFKLAHEAKCYREFLKTAELDQLNWAEKQEIFEKNLPYAVAFGLTKKWVNVFGNAIQVPKWIHTNNINNLSRDISKLTSDISRNIQAPRTSSGRSGFGGGGFSGGGSGGGGGGSW